MIPPKIWGLDARAYSAPTGKRATVKNAPEYAQNQWKPPKSQAHRICLATPLLGARLSGSPYLREALYKCLNTIAVFINL